MIARLVHIVISALLLISSSHALSLITTEDGETVAQVLVDFRSQKADSKDRWLLRALEAKFIHDIGTYKRIRWLNKKDIDNGTCALDLACLIPRYQNQGVDIYILGELGVRSINWRSFDTKTGLAMASGQLRTGPGASFSQLKIAAMKSLSPFMKRGGIIDQLSLKTQQENSQSFSLTIDREGLPSFAESWLASSKTILAQTLMLALFLLITISVSMALWWRRKIKQAAANELASRQSSSPTDLEDRLGEHTLPPLPAAALNKKQAPLPLLPFASGWRMILGAILISLFFIWYRPEAFGLSQWDQALLKQTWLNHLANTYQWAAPIPAGALWVWLGIQFFRLIIPSLAGFESLHPSGVFSTLASCAVVSSFRLLLITLITSPFLLLGWAFLRALDIPLQSGLNPIIPATLLLTWGFMGMLLDCISQYFDREAVSGVASSENPWNIVIHLWLDQWFKEEGFEPDLERLRSIVFLPGKASDLVVYGGGFTQPRVVINEKLLFRAFRNERLRHKVSPEDLLDGEMPVGKDFLKAILLTALAQIHRHNHWIHCLSLMVRKVRELSPRANSVLAAPIEKLIASTYARHPHRLVDAYVCSHGYLYHHIQFLGFQLWRDARHLTTAGGRQILRDESRRILKRAKEIRPDKLPHQKRILWQRLMWLEQLSNSSASDVSKGLKLTWRAVGLASLLSLMISAYYIRESYLYHQVYVDRIALQAEELAERKLKRKGNTPLNVIKGDEPLK